MVYTQISRKLLSALRPTGRLQLSTLKKKNGDLSQIEVNKVLRLMSHIAAKVSAHNHVPENRAGNNSEQLIRHPAPRRQSFSAALI